MSKGNSCLESVHQHRVITAVHVCLFLQDVVGIQGGVDRRGESSLNNRVRTTG